MEHRSGILPHPRGEVLVALCLVVAVACTARAWADGVADSGICARCHEIQAGLAASEGGHAAFLDCTTCHEIRRAGVGRRHRTIPRDCTRHHATPVQTHPTPARTLKPRRLQRRCLKCHEPHGSENAHLVRSRIRKRGRLHPIDFQAAGGVVPGGFVDPVNPGTGLCEICHRNTRFYTASGDGESHYTSDCSACHDHAAGFGPVVTDANCALCHPDQAARLARGNLHQAKFSNECSACHAEVTPEAGPGHRAKADCADCHSPERVATHAPGMAIPCTQCHDPHGSDNIRLVRDVIRTLQGTDQPVQFDSLTGRADGSFASESAPGAGLCEICHTKTQFYRADGGGLPHHVESCIRCHLHAQGFAP
jgi:predicted CXXCH cytochrome family protein